jgi:hypothetical protein
MTRPCLVAFFNVIGDMAGNARLRKLLSKKAPWER